VQKQLEESQSAKTSLKLLKWHAYGSVLWYTKTSKIRNGYTNKFKKSLNK